MGADNGIEYEVEAEDQIQPSRYRKEGSEFFYWSPLRQRWYRVVNWAIIPNYGDVEIAFFQAGNDKLGVLRARGQILDEDEPYKILYPRGDVVAFKLENGNTVYQDSGEDPDECLFNLVKSLVEPCNGEKPFHELTTLKGIVR